MSSTSSPPLLCRGGRRRRLMATLCLALISLSLLLLTCSFARVHAQPSEPAFADFDIAPVSWGQENPPWAARNSFATFTTATPLNYTTLVSGVATDLIAPPGSFILLGNVDSNVWLSPDNGASWVLLAGPLGSTAPWNQTVAPQYRTTFTPNAAAAICKEPLTDRIYHLMNQAVQFTDDGRTWQSITVSNLPARAWFPCVTGRTAVFSIANPVWVSTDRGQTWASRPGFTFASGGSPASTSYYSTAFSRDILVVAGGLSGASNPRTGINAVWVSSDLAQTWALVSSNAPWQARFDMKIAAFTNGVLVVSSGTPNDGDVFNDVWMSADGGYNWWLLRNFATATPRLLPALTFDNNGYLWVFGGTEFIYRNNVGVKVAANTYRRSTQRFDMQSIMSWGPKVVRSLYLPPANCTGLTCWPGQPCACYNPDDFNFRFQSQPPLYRRQNVGFTLVRAAMTYTGRQNATNPSVGSDNPLVTKTAPVGSYIAWGGWNGTVMPADSWISTDLLTWEPISGPAATNIGLVNGTDFVQFTMEDGMSRCSSRTQNRYYMMASTASGSVWTSTDGRMWSRVSTALTGRPWSVCYVSTTGAVYHLWRNSLMVSNDQGATWTAVTAMRPITQRESPSIVVYTSTPLSREVAVMVGGVWSGANFNDVWVTTDNGANWYMTTSAAAWPARADAAAVADSNGLLVVMMGQAKNFAIRYNDAWFSADGGYTWWELTSSDAVTSRTFPGVVISPGGFIVTVAGGSASGATNDVYISDLSLNAVATWGPRIAPGFVAPPSSCFGLVCVPTLLCVCGNGTIARMDLSVPSWVTVPTWTARAGFGVYRLTNSQTYTVNTSNVITQYTVPATSWVMYGGGASSQDVWLSTNKGGSWSAIAGRPNDPSIPNGFWASFSGLEGQAGCKSPTTDTFVAMGGKNSTTWLNDVWTSGNGQTWVQRQMRGASGPGTWPGRAYHLCTITSDGAIYVTGGNSASYSAVDDDTYVSTDSGVTWSLVNVNRTYPSRAAFFGGAAQARGWGASVIYAAGGVSFRNYNDVWVTSDGARNWLLLTATAPWQARADTSLTFSDNGVMVLYGGQMNSFERYFSDLWASFDGGYNWWLIAPFTSVTPRSFPATLFDEQGFFWVFGGSAMGTNSRDVFRSSLSFTDASVESWIQTVAPGTVVPRHPTSRGVWFGLSCWPGSTCVFPPPPVPSSSAPVASSLPVQSSAPIASSAPISSSVPISSSAPRASSSIPFASSSAPFASSSVLPSSTGDAILNPDSASSSSSLSNGAIAGIVIAVVVGTVLIAALVIFLKSRANKSTGGGGGSGSSHDRDVEMSSV